MRNDITTINETPKNKQIIKTYVSHETRVFIKKIKDNIKDHFAVVFFYLNMAFIMSWKLR